MRILFALPGFHRYERGAEVALLSVADELAKLGESVTVIGAGEPREGVRYRYKKLGAARRERFERLPSIPGLRDETKWEDATFAANLAAKEDLSQYDVTVTCNFPFTNLALQRGRRKGPRNVFVTQNGDWPAFSNDSEYRLFNCDGLVCTNPSYLERNRDRWNCTLIPNGVDVARFTPASSAEKIACRERLKLPQQRPIVLMVSAFIRTKRVLDGIRAVAQHDGAHLVVAGDGPLRAEGDRLAAELLPNRFTRLSLQASEMPQLYRAADVFMHLSEFESFGNVYLEAWASGLPVVAHDFEVTRWIYGDTQYLCDTGDEAALEEKLRLALVAPVGKAPEGIDQFTWPEIANNYRNFFSQFAAVSEAK
ncbi:glycosyltransferase family 4 protein [Qipengyuania atrilutea]|uniref:Glycosyltransferase family 4 protein n=1 Tax=Qipengyuania atrilutea TaxID=2744473 RepID=A0A850H8Z8_9SPHN|nr:glycosyltransferase family 4 protein [Actirhodobacter atriluteus]NVD45755.1 glycosyltransferase family 4 protein [Actirhodobacter atriluteus]